MTNGKIIIITGGPCLGKSILVKKIANYYKGEAILEGEEKDFPKRILENIKDNKRILELILYFRNKIVSDYIKALKFKNQGKIVIMDTYWMTNDVYVDEWLTDKFERSLMKKVSKIDEKLLPQPDIILSLTASKNSLHSFLKTRKRSFEQDSQILTRYFRMVKLHDKFFKNKKLKNIIFIDRTKLDFETKKDFQLIIKTIDKYFKK